MSKRETKVDDDLPKVPDLVDWKLWEECVQVIEEAKRIIRGSSGGVEPQNHDVLAPS